MSARPALKALACRSCQTAIYRAVLPPFASGIRHGLYQSKPQYQLRSRYYSSEIPNNEKSNQNQLEEEEAGEKSAEAEAEDEAPWFLEEEAPRHVSSLHKANLPKAPEDGPAMIEPMIKYIYEDMGLDEISLLDLRDLNPAASLGPNLIMLFATTRSERHLHISSGRFVRWLRRNYNVDAKADGLIGAGELKTKLRRLRKKAKLMGSNTAMIPGGDNGISTGWVCVNFALNGNGASESAVFDDGGKFSGFGTSTTGTTVVVQCLTEGRREELDLESLWKGILRRSLEQQTKVRGEAKQTASELDEILASKLQIHTTPAKAQWDALAKASQQHRYYSTTARRLNSNEVSSSSTTSEPKATPSTPSGTLQVEDLEPASLRQAVENIQYRGAPMDQSRVEELVLAIFQSPESSEFPVMDRLALLDEILRTAEERGLGIQFQSRDFLVWLIVTVVDSPVYGTELKQAQAGLEMLLRNVDVPPTDEQTANLMVAYAARQDWDRVWDAFRTPSRFNLARSRQLYELAYRTIATTKDPNLCRDVLRWMVQEMLTENPAVPPTGGIYSWLKAAILVADPGAEQLLNSAPPALKGSLEERRRERDEFSNMLREVETLRAQL